MSAVPSSRLSTFERVAVGAIFVALVIGCYLIVRPFLTAFLWGSIISVSTRGLFMKVLGLVRGKRKLAAFLTGLLLVLVLLVPIAALAMNVTSEMPKLTARFKTMVEGGLGQPPGWLGGVPLVGKAASERWQGYAADPQSLREDLRPFLTPVKDFLVAAVSGVSLGILEFLLSIIIAGLLYIHWEKVVATVDRVAFRLAGESGRRQVLVVRSTIRGVFKGMLGTCAVQAILAMIGFWVSGVPNAFLLGMGTFFLSFVPGGPTVLWLPAALWLNSQGSTGWAIFLGLWGLLIVGGSDNIVRPLLIGRGVEAPMAIIFLGVIGGLLAFGFLGLFIGPTFLSVAYNLFDEWMKSETGAPTKAEAT